MKEKKVKNKFKVYLPMLIVSGLIIAAGVYWYQQYAKYIKTDDAYVDADNVSVSAKMMGRIARIHVKEGDEVKPGDLVAELDSTDMLAQKEHLEATKEQATTNLTQMQAQYAYSKQSVKVLEVNLSTAQTDLARAKSQFQGGVIPQEKLDHAQSAWESAKAQVVAAQAKIKVVAVQVEAAKAAINAAQAQIQVMKTQLKNTRLRAPFAGIVAKKWLLPGDVVQPGQAVLTITNNRQQWVVVYLEETKVAQVHKEQEVQLAIDAYPGEIFLGKVFWIGSNTASQFSLIPPNNASGNFTKVTQRVPLKISIDKTRDNQDLASFPLMAGMSVVVKIVKNK